MMFLQQGQHLAYFIKYWNHTTEDQWHYILFLSPLHEWILKTPFMCLDGNELKTSVFKSENCCAQYECINKNEGNNIHLNKYGDKIHIHSVQNEKQGSYLTFDPKRAKALEIFLKSQHKLMFRKTGSKKNLSTEVFNKTSIHMELFNLS